MRTTFESTPLSNSPPTRARDTVKLHPGLSLLLPSYRFLFSHRSSTVERHSDPVATATVLSTNLPECLTGLCTSRVACLEVRLTFFSTPSPHALTSPFPSQAKLSAFRLCALPRPLILPYRIILERAHFDVAEFSARLGIPL